MRFMIPMDWGTRTNEIGQRNPVTPRRWQEEAFEAWQAHYEGAPEGTSGLIRAVTGSGKAILLAQIAASIELDKHETIVISTSTINLVKQLSATLRDRLDPEFMIGDTNVGCFYTYGKDIRNPVIVTCTPSVGELAEALKSIGKRCALWIADEAHRSEAEKIKAAALALQPYHSLGATATPYRANEKERLTLFQPNADGKPIYDYGPKRAIADGVVVLWDTVAWEGGEASLDKACIDMTQFAKGPGMFSALNIADAEVFCMKLRDAGMKAEAIHSKLKDSEIKTRIEKLRVGELNAIVHVSMLQEGIDLPWLYWLCLRRPISSRVRFAQEIGRVLRAYVDPVTGVVKKRATIFDPHGLFEDFSMSYEAVLGGEYDDDEKKELDVGADDVDAAAKMEQQTFELIDMLLAARCGKGPLNVTPLQSYLRELVTAFDVCGMISRKITARSWRTQRPTAKQLTTMENIRWMTTVKQMPKVHQQALRLINEQAPQLNKGTCADWIDICKSVADLRFFPDFSNLKESAVKAIERQKAFYERKQKDQLGKGEVNPASMAQPKVEARKMQQDMLFEEEEFNG